LVPVSRVQVIQPEFAGRITAINVRNGAFVTKGSTLVEFDATDAITELGTITAEKQRLNIELARIIALVRALSLDLERSDFLTRTLEFFELPEDLAQHSFATEQRELLEAKAHDLLASLAQIDSRQEVNRRSEQVTQANITRVESILEIQSERMRMMEQLMERGATSRVAFLDVQQTYTETERQHDVYLRELEQKVAEGAALDSERQGVVSSLRSAQLERVAHIDSRLATLAEEARAAERRVAAAELKAPLSGIVDQLKIHTIGGVAVAGEELMRIVPTNVQIEVEGAFNNDGIGFIEVGQSANIRLDAYPSERFGFVKGEVSDIAADSAEISEGQWSYIVRVTPDQAFLKAGKDNFALKPGMTAKIDVTTDKRRIISYFLAPIVRTVQDALGER
jgi:hemolysin D